MSAPRSTTVRARPLRTRGLLAALALGLPAATIACSGASETPAFPLDQHAPTELLPDHYLIGADASDLWATDGTNRHAAHFDGHAWTAVRPLPDAWRNASVRAGDHALYGLAATAEKLTPDGTVTEVASGLPAAGLRELLVRGDRVCVFVQDADFVASVWCADNGVFTALAPPPAHPNNTDAWMLSDGELVLPSSTDSSSAAEVGLYFNGNAWEVLPRPEPALSRIRGVARVAKDDLWVGLDDGLVSTFDFSPSQPMKLGHWDGKAWSMRTVAIPPLSLDDGDVLEVMAAPILLSGGRLAFPALRGPVAPLPGVKFAPREASVYVVDGEKVSGPFLLARNAGCGATSCEVVVPGNTALDGTSLFVGGLHGQERFFTVNFETWLAATHR